MRNCDGNQSKICNQEVNSIFFYTDFTNFHRLIRNGNNKLIAVIVLIQRAFVIHKFIGVISQNPL